MRDLPLTLKICEKLRETEKLSKNKRRGKKELELTAKENTATLGKQSAEYQAGLQEF